jgi:uncharacterized membrane protein YagU involved in acid resistance
MQRLVAIIITLVVFIFFTLIAYYGARITLWSSIILSIFLSLIILNVFYPLSQIPNDVADYTLILYALIEIIGAFLLGIYIIQCAVCDVRDEQCLC